MNKEKLWNICLEIYSQMYQETKPKVNFNKLMKKGVTKQREWFMKYYLPMERQIEIIDEYCRKYKIRKFDKNLIDVEIYLGCSPNSNQKTWEEYQKK